MSFSRGAFMPTSTGSSKPKVGIDKYIPEGYRDYELSYMREASAKLNGFEEVKGFLIRVMNEYKEEIRKNPPGMISEFMGFMDGKVSTFFCGKTKETYLAELEQLLASVSKKEDLSEKISEGLKICVMGVSNRIRCALEVACYVLKYKDQEAQPDQVRSLYEIL